MYNKLSSTRGVKCKCRHERVHNSEDPWIEKLNRFARTDALLVGDHRFDRDTDLASGAKEIPYAPHIADQCYRLMMGLCGLQHKLDRLFDDKGQMLLTGDTTKEII